MKRVLFAMLFCLLCAGFSQAQQPEFSVSYMHQGSQPVLGGDWFGSNGGRADVSVPFSHHLSVVGEFSGVHTDSMNSSGIPLTLLTYMAGPRVSFCVCRGPEAARNITPFAQALFGGAHATEGAFPVGATLSSTADSFAMSFGGGLEVGVSRRVALRVVQADYLYTRLPNLFNNNQNNYRIGAGVVMNLR